MSEFLKGKIPYNKKNRPSKDWLIERYVHQHLPISKIAFELKIGETTLNRWFKDYDIPKRKSSDIQLPKGFVEPTKEELYRLYVEEHRPVNEIAKHLGVSWGYVQRALKKHNTKFRSHNESIRPKGFVKPLKEELHKWIYDEGKTVNQIAKEKNVSTTAIRNYMRELGIFSKKRGLNRVPNGWWTKERVISEIKKIRAENGDLSANYCMKKRSSLFHAGYDLFDGWENAIHSTGIDYSIILKHKQWSKQEILNEILKLSKEGVNLSHKNIKKIRRDLISPSEYHFGSWAQAVNSAGIDYFKTVAINKNKFWTKEKIIEEIKKLYSAGHMLNSQSMQKSKNRDLFDAAKVKFGSWENAINNTNLDYQKLSKLKAQTKSFKEKLHAKLTEEKLTELYVTQGLSTVELGILYDVSATVISNLLKKHKIELKKPKYGYKELLVCKDKHRVKSNFERTVCDWLYFNGIEHEYEPRISSDRYFKADFKIGRFYIEILGMMEIPEYRRKFEEKIMHFSMKEGVGFIYCKGEEVPKYKKYFDTNNNKSIVILLIPQKHKLTKETINEQLGFLIPLFSKSQRNLS
ncbi:hypothetical protein J4234_00610 [Candidatus Woesearchaeota archaeon]|nr:hypothetical protein [Candidatus Woesearchaeota archaeon]